MKVSTQALFFLLLIPNCMLAQMSHNEFGARSKGVGNSNSTLTDEWSLFNNVGGISGVEEGVVFFGYDRYIEVEGFDRVAAGVIQPLKFGNVGISFYRFGDQLYSEQTASLAYGNKIGFVRLGFKINYYQIRIEEFGTAGSLYYELGGIVDLVPKLTFGAFISNFTLSSFNNSERSELPVIMKLGLKYTPIDNLSLSLDIYKDVDYKPILKAGIEYLIIEKLYVRTGVNTNPLKSFFGIGLMLDRFKVDYALSSHDFLGISHQVSISFSSLKINEK